MKEQDCELEQEVLLDKLSTIGLTVSDYHSALKALKEEDIPAIMELNRLAEERISRMRIDIPEIQQLGTNSEEKNRLHESIVEDIVAPLVPTDHPTFTIFAGPPGTGKTTAQKKYVEAGDHVITDPTIIQKKLRADFDESDYAQIIQTNNEAFEVAQKLIDRAFELGLSIMSESTLQNIPWAEKSIGKALEHGYGVNIVFIHKPWHQCFQDAIENRQRPIAINYLLKSLRGYSNLLYFDTKHGVNVTVIGKKNNFDQSVIYEDDKGELQQNTEFAQIHEKASRLSGLIV